MSRTLLTARSIPKPLPPTIAGSPSTAVVSTLTITPGGGGPVTSYRLYRDGISAGTLTSPYTYTQADIGPSLTVKAIGPGGISAASNILQYVRPTANLAVDLDGTHVTLSGGFISAVLDQSGLGNDYGDVGAAGNRPAQSVGGGPNGRDAINFALRAAAAVGVTKADVGLGTGPVTLYDLVQVPANGRYACDGAAINKRVKTNNGGTSLALYAGSMVAGVAVIPGDFVISSAVFNGASSKHAIDGGTAATGNVGANTSPGDTWGGAAGAANPAQCLNALAARRLVYAAAHSDAARAEIEAYLQWWKANSPGYPRILPMGDSIVYGANGYVGGWRAAALTTIQASRPTASLVGPFYSVKAHYGVSGRLLSDYANTFSTRVDAPIDQTLPDVVYLACGVNDLGANADAATIESRLNTVIDRIQLDRPSAHILVQSIIKPGAGAAGFYGSNRAVADTVNANLPALCTAQGVTFVDVGAPSLGADSIHPDATGYAAMAAIIAPAIVAVT